MSDHDKKIKDYSRYTNIGSGIALVASGVASGVAAVVAAPIVTGVLIGAAAVSSSVAAYNYYKKLEEEKKSDVSEIDT